MISFRPKDSSIVGRSLKEVSHCQHPGKIDVNTEDDKQETTGYANSNRVGVDRSDLQADSMCLFFSID